MVVIIPTAAQHGVISTAVSSGGMLYVCMQFVMLLVHVLCICVTGHSGLQGAAGASKGEFEQVDIRGVSLTQITIYPRYYKDRTAVCILTPQPN